MIDKYKLAFQEEARELLSELESALLELDQKRQDPEVVGRASRALHTIKGSGAVWAGRHCRLPTIWKPPSTACATDNSRPPRT